MLIENSSFPAWAAYKSLDLKPIPGLATQHDFGENYLNCLRLNFHVCKVRIKGINLLGFMRFIIIMLRDLIRGTEFKHLLFSLAWFSPCNNSHSGHALKLFVWEVWCKPLEGNREPWKENTDDCMGGKRLSCRGESVPGEKGGCVQK